MAAQSGEGLSLGRARNSVRQVQVADIVQPGGEYELLKLIEEAAAARTPLEIGGRGSKRAVGRPVQAEAIVSTAKMSGITLYEPNELNYT